MTFSLAITLLIFTCSAAVIEGKIYSWETFEPLSNVIVEINTTPPQKILSKDGSYSFNVSPGNYVIRALYYRNGELLMKAEENITVEREGTYRIDILLTPVIKFEEVNLENVSFEDVEVKSYGYYPVIALIVLITFFTAFFILRVVKTDSVDEDLPEDLKKVLEEIERSGGRITQKELREKLKVSEAKLSLMLTDLERRGMIEKFKKGRGNVIFLKK